MIVFKVSTYNKVRKNKFRWQLQLVSIATADKNKLNEIPAVRFYTST